MKQRIVFVYPKMVMGGAEQVLLRLIENIDRNKYAIQVILLKHGGELEHSFPKDVVVRYAEPLQLNSLLKKGKIIDFIKGIYYRVRIRLAKTYEEESIYSAKCVSVPYTDPDDCIICYSHYNFMSIYLTKKMKARKRILWVHLSFRENMDKNRYFNALKEFTDICCVSQFAKNEFDKNFPSLSGRSQVIHNLIDKNVILKLAKEKTNTDMKHISILTVARLDKQKGLGLIPGTVRHLIENGYDVYWYIVGEGDFRKELEQLISENNLEERVFLLGERKNPFPYMRLCDIYCQPSFYEGFCTTVNEARILCKPMVVSKIESSFELIDDGKTGFIAELNEKKMAEKIGFLIDHPKTVQMFTENLNKLNIDNKTELEKLYDIIGEKIQE